MTIHRTDDQVTIHHGDCLDVLAEMPDDSIDAIVTDAPYGLEFMGKEWDSFKTYSGGNPNMKPQGATVGDEPAAVTHGYRQKNPRCTRCGKLKRGNGSCKCPDPRWDTRTSESAFQFQMFNEAWARECLRVLKPGGHLLAFGGTRTWHRLAVAVEDAGFEMRDSIAWLHSQGYPKAKGQLKPAFEPIVVARKPLQGTVAANLLAHGTGALNIDATRVEGAPRPEMVRTATVVAASSMSGTSTGATSSGQMTTAGRWPANVVLSDDAAAELDAQSGTLTSGTNATRTKVGSFLEHGGLGRPGDVQTTYGDSGGASRFFPVFRYQAKAPTRERPSYVKPDGSKVAHPTCKPLDLMAWLVRLVTPPGGTVLDPFAGSGTTIEACISEGFRVTGIEREADYLPLIDIRIARQQPTLFGLSDEQASNG